MASAASTTGNIHGRVDRSGRLVAADPELATVQLKAGGIEGGLLALPQLAVIARLAFRLGVLIERPALMATEQADIHCWVRALPVGEEVELSLDNWIARPPREARLAVADPEFELAPPNKPRELGWTCDGDLKFTDVTQAFAELLGVLRDEAIGMPLTKLLRLVDDGDGDMPIIEALAARRDFAGQQARGRAHLRAGLVIDGEALHDAEGKFIGFRGTAAAEGAESGLPAAPKDSGRVTSALDSSFEEILRLPIERIVAEAEKIADRSDGPLRGDYAAYGGDIAAAARHLLSVIAAMGEDPEFGRGLIDLAALAAEAVVLVEPIAENRKVAIALASTPPKLASGEEHAVIQILVNLLVNAIRHSPPRTTVTISFGGGEGRSEVTVTDQGVGIAPEDHKRIFERFERADEQPGGTGLGLAIARRLARSMGGEVSLESAPGKGASFTLSLPLS